MMYSDRFLQCLPYTLAQECPRPKDWSNPKNFSNDAHDPGGETMCGIIQREYDAYRKSIGELTQPVRLITEDEGKEIYFTSYWMPHCPDLNAGCDLVFFDTCVNEGQNEATKILQYTLGCAVDGNYGPLTVAAVKNIADQHAFIRAYSARRSAVYQMMAGYKYFGVDWERRTSDIKAAALRMLEG